MATADKCPYCNSRDIKRTTSGYISNGIGIAAGCAIDLFASSIGIPHTQADSVVKEYMPTNYKCNRCNKEFDVTSVDGDIVILNDDAPENIRKVEMKKSLKYSCEITKVDLSTWWNRMNTYRVITSYGDYSSKEVDKIISNLPWRVSFDSQEYLIDFKKSLSNYNGETR